jgi:hypothetical protein
VSGSPAGANEVDQAEWVPIDEAASRLSYVHDVEVLSALSDALRQ